jgi:hypothetical protein
MKFSVSAKVHRALRRVLVPDSAEDLPTSQLEQGMRRWPARVPRGTEDLGAPNLVDGVERSAQLVPGRLVDTALPVLYGRRAATCGFFRVLSSWVH